MNATTRRAIDTRLAMSAGTLALLLALISAPIAAQQLASDTAALAAALIESGGVTRGVCGVIGADRDLAVRIAESSELLVHVREPDAESVAEQRRQADAAGLGIDRLVVERGEFNPLPYADNTIDLLVATAAGEAMLSELSPAEVLRVLCPGGTARIGSMQPGAPSPRDYREWARLGGVRGVKTERDTAGTWLRVTKPLLDGADDWPHWEHGPDNNPVSTDSAIKAPYLTQFLAEPYHITMPSITTAAGGRTFLATGHIAHHVREWEIGGKLIARNGYNGTVLWQRNLPEGYLAHRSAFYATDDVFHMIDGDSCLMLDARTGDELGRIRVPGTEGDWKWMATDDGVLYVMSGDRTGQVEAVKGDRNFGGWGWGDLSPGYYTQPRVPWGFGNTLAAYDLKRERVIWTHAEATPIDSRALAIRDGRLFAYSPDAHLRCLAVDTGEELWTNDDQELLDLIETPGRGLISTPGFRSACMAVAVPGALILQAQTRANVVAVSAEDGRLLWQKQKISNNPNVMSLDEGVVLGVGKQSNHVIVDPLTGAVVEELGFRKVACTRLTACPDSLFVRGEGTLRMDRSSRRIIIDGGVRPGCNDGALPANGMLYIGPWACDCNLSLIGAMAKCSAGDFRFDHVATDDERLELGEGDILDIAAFEIADTDWPTYRGNNERTGSTPVRPARPNAPEGTPRAPFWTHSPEQPTIPTPPTCAGGVVFVAGRDGKVRALDARNGQPSWVFATGGPI